MEKFLLSLLCLLTVAFGGKAEEKTYELCTDLNEILNPDNEFLIVSTPYSGKIYGVKTSQTSVSGVEIGSFDSTPQQITLDITANNIGLFSFKTNGDYYALYDSVSEIYIGAKSASKTDIVVSNTLPSTNTYQLAVSMNEQTSVVTIQAQASTSRSFFFQKGTAFKNYATSNSTNKDYQTVTLYKEVSTSDPTKEDAEVSFGEDSKRVFDLYNTTIDSFKTPVLTKTEGISVSFESSDTNVATVSETGEVTLTGELGSTRITASFAGDDKYNAASDYYTITVSKAFANVKDVIACANDTQGLVDFPLTVAYAHGKNVFAFDAAGDFIQVYGDNNCNANDVIPAGWKANYTLYSDCTPELVPVDAVPTAVETAEFTAKVVDAQDITAELVNSVLTLNNVTFDAETPANVSNFTGVSNEVELTFRNAYQLESQAAGKYNVTFVVNLYMAKNATEAVLQLYPIAFEAVEAEKPEMPELEGEFTLTDGELKVDNVTSVRIKFNRKNANHEIYYMLTEATAESENGQNSDPESVNGGSLPTPLATRAAAEHDHAGYTKLEGDELEVKNTHSQLAYFVCDPETAAHSDIKTLALAIGNTAVAEVEMAEGEAKYFDLQGREVKGAPESGIYVRVKNGKSTKVLIK